MPWKHGEVLGMKGTSSHIFQAPAEIQDLLFITHPRDAWPASSQASHLAETLLDTDERQESTTKCKSGCFFGLHFSLARLLPLANTPNARVAG